MLTRNSETHTLKRRVNYTKLKKETRKLYQIKKRDTYNNKCIRDIEETN